MGKVGSKIKLGDWKKGNKDSEVDSAPDDRADEYRDEELMLLRRAIEKDPNSFILNNLMMCIQFFENYEENVIEVKETLASSYEAKLNKKLPPHKHILMPDTLQEYIARNIAFTSTRQTFRPTIEPLQPVRLYVVHDNIEITEQHYQPEYSSVSNAITYNMLVKPSENQGYVRLELLDETPYSRNHTKKDDLDPSADDDETYSDGDSIYVPRLNARTALPRHIKRNHLQTTSKISNVRSLPNLHDDETIYEDQAYHSRENIYAARSDRDIKAESDYEHVSSASDERRNRGKRTWSKSEMAGRTAGHQRHPRPGALTKLKKTNGRSPAGSTSSGYRSGHYAVDSDSDSSCHTMQSSDLASSCGKTSRDVTASCGAAQIYAEKSAAAVAAAADPSTEIYSLSNAKIPQRCFKKLMHTREGKIYDQREERRQLQNSKQRRLRRAMRRRNYEVSYTSSAEFMRHFVNLFRDHLGQLLGFDQEDLDELKPDGSIVYCDKVMLSHNSRFCRIDSYEITPTIWLQWPECAQEWLYRPRSTWPSYDDTGKIKDFGCYVVPEGFVPKRGFNMHQEIEWQLTFPAAERYLETCMTRSQAQVYLIALMLHKSFIRPVFDTLYGLTASHIRNKMFWLIEEDDRPSKWPDNRTGECLIKLLNGLYRCLSQNEPILPDYFVRDKNVFQRVPSDHLLHTQKQLKRILENPVMYVFHAMENIRHSDKFYPRLDYELLLKILTMDTLTLLNPALGQHMHISSSASTSTRMSAQSRRTVRDETYDRSGGFWDSAKTRTEQKAYSTRVVTNKTLINPRKATDSIIEISVRCAELEGPRLGALLDFFVRHFIKMAERCHQYRAYQQKKVYLDQADRLSIILTELARYKDDAVAYREKIQALRTRATGGRSQNEPPATPKRNQEAPLFAGALKNRFTRQTVDVVIESKNEGAESSGEDRRDGVARTVTRLKKTGGARATAAKTSDDGTSRIARKPVTRDRSDKSATGTIQKVVSLADDQNESFLTETTYI